MRGNTRLANYRCTNCGVRQVDDPPGTPGGKLAKDKLFRKRVNWYTLGAVQQGGFKLVKARTVGVYCLPCMENDPQFQLKNRAGNAWTRARMMDDAPPTPKDFTTGVPEGTPPAETVLDDPPT